MNQHTIQRPSLKFLSFLLSRQSRLPELVDLLLPLDLVVTFRGSYLETFYISRSESKISALVPLGEIAAR